MDTNRIFVCPPKKYHLQGNLKKNNTKRSLQFRLMLKRSKSNSVHKVSKIILERFQINAIINYDTHDINPLEVMPRKVQ